MSGCLDELRLPWLMVAQTRLPAELRYGRTMCWELLSDLVGLQRLTVATVPADVNECVVPLWRPVCRQACAGSCLLLLMHQCSALWTPYVPCQGVTAALQTAKVKPARTKRP